MTPRIEKLRDELFGRTDQGCCVKCKHTALMGKNIHTEAGQREFLISGLCEDCFDTMFAE
jgi:hypothetical protein